MDPIRRHRKIRSADQFRSIESLKACDSDIIEPSKFGDMNSSDRHHSDPSAIQSFYQLDKLHALDNTVDMRFFANQVERIESYNNELGDDDYGDDYESMEDSPESGSVEVTNSD